MEKISEDINQLETRIGHSVNDLDAMLSRTVIEFVKNNVDISRRELAASILLSTVLLVIKQFIVCEKMGLDGGLPTLLKLIEEHHALNHKAISDL